MEIKKIEKGDKYSLSFSYTQDQVIAFASATGDDNPIHLDNDFASQTVFGKPIIHGFLGGSIFSKIFGTIFPGNGTIYLKQSLVFMKPMFTGEAYIAIVEIIETIKEKNRATVSTKIFNSNNEEVISGEALISNKVKL